MSGAYYNEFDPGAAAWLRELIRRGLIADGEVDERSILDVQPDDLRGFTQCHFFAGIGGWSYALRLAGIPDDMPCWTGSPPCQPFSTAGEQKGKDDERHLAPHFAALVADVRPPILFGEQVASAAVFGRTAKSSRRAAEREPEWAWIDDLQDRLEAAHYAVGASDIPAAGVGAPHIRQRTFFGAVRLADADSERRDREHSLLQRVQPGWQQEDSVETSGRGKTSRLADADERQCGWFPDGEGCQHNRTERGRQQGNSEPERSGTSEWLADSTHEQHNRTWIRREAGWSEHTDSSADDRLADAVCCGQQGQREVGRSGNPEEEANRQEHRIVHAGRCSGMADASSSQRKTNGVSCGVQSSNDSIGGSSPYNRLDQQQQGIEHNCRQGAEWTSTPHSFWADADWLYCRDGKWRPVEPGTQPLAHGVSARVVRLRGYGNAIVPQAAAAFITAFMESL